MTTDLTAADTAAMQAALAVDHRLKRDDKAKLQAELAIVRAELQACEAMERSLALNEDLDDDALDDVLDVEAGLSEILTRHEGEL